MYLAIIVLLMGVLPIVSVIAEYFVLNTSSDLLFLVGRWFVFWGTGVRQFTAGLSQTFNPGYTSQTIFRIPDPNAEKLVREIGFGNLAMGAIGLLSILNDQWVAPAATASLIYYALAALGHWFNRERTAVEAIPLWSDILFSIVLLGFLAATFASGRGA
jgi:hypothetical protein